MNPKFFCILAFAFSVLVCLFETGCSREDLEEAQRLETEKTQKELLAKKIEIPEFDPPAEKLENGEMSHVVVQHILIAFKIDIRAKRNGGKSTTGDDKVTRSRSKAEELAKDLLNQAKLGADFNELAIKFSDDGYPGIYRLANSEQRSNINSEDVLERIFPREKMAIGFGDVSFKLKVGEVGLAEFDPAKSPFGWHIIKRLK